MTKNIIISGFGGQGVLSLGQFLAYASMFEGMETTWLPSYGPEMRGGTANCSLVISDKSIASPIIKNPDILIALNKPSLDRFLSNVKKGGIVIINSSIIKEPICDEGIEVVYLPTNEIVQTLGNLKVANVVVLGAFIAITKLFSMETIKKTIEKIFANKPNVIPLNFLALEAGFKAISKEK